MPTARLPRILRRILISMLAAVPITAGAVDFKIATLAPDGTVWMQEMRAGAEEIARRTAGRVNFKFYPGGSMGSDRGVLRKIRAGQLHGGALTGGALSDVHPDTQIYSLPFLFRSYDELDYVRARMDKTFARLIEERGFVTFGFTDGGFAYIMSSQPTRGIADLRTQKVWIPEGDDISHALFNTLGISPVPLPLTDVLTGLQTGLITTVASSPVGAIALQWHGKVKYVADVPTLYVYGTLAIDKKSYNRLSPADQQVMREVMERVFASLNRQTRVDDRNARDALRKEGIEFQVLSAEELAKLHAAADQTIERLAGQQAFSTALLRQLQGHVAAYRRTAGR